MDLTGQAQILSAFKYPKFRACMYYISTFGASQQMPQIPAIKSAFGASSAAEQPLALLAIVYELLLNLK